MITINEVELASNLADLEMSNEVINDNENYPNYTCSDDLVEVDEDGMIVYKEDVQTVFDRWYDFYYNQIMDTEVKKQN